MPKDGFRVLFLRVPLDIHELLHQESKRVNWSVNCLANEMLRQALEKPSPAASDKRTDPAAPLASKRKMVGRLKRRRPSPAMSKAKARKLAVSPVRPAVVKKKGKSKK